MRAADFARLKKMMALTASDNDHEALAALRAANAIIRSSGHTWPEVLERVVTVVPEFEADPSPPGRGAGAGAASPRRPQADEAAHLFRLLEDLELDDKTLEFVNSLRNSFRRFGTLSERQQAALNEVVERTTERQARRPGGRWA